MIASNSSAFSHLVNLIRTKSLSTDHSVIGQVLAEGGDARKSVFQLGLYCAQQGAMSDALLLFSGLLQVDTTDVRIPYNLGLIHAALGNHHEAVVFYRKALDLDPSDVATLVNKAISHVEIGERDLALDLLNQAIFLDPSILEAYLIKGDIWNGLEKYEQALDCYEAALNLNPSHSKALNNKGVALYGLGRHQEAIACYDRTLSTHPSDKEVLSNKGNALSQMGCYEEALKLYDQALQIDPSFVMAFSNKGYTLARLKRYEEAIIFYDKALELKPDFDEALVNKANELIYLKRYEEAITCYERALDHAGHLDWVWGELVHANLHICQWSGLAKNLQALFDGVTRQEKTITPFPLLGLSDDPKMHRQCAHLYVIEEYPPDNRLGPLHKPRLKDKIKIGYFSADFKCHPVAFLVSELFELHDRDHFEIYGFSLAKAPDGDATRERIKKGVDHFYELEDKSEIDIAILVRKLSIDIAVDLTGFTQEAKTKIFTYRVASIQVNYLGYPGTMGADYMDYLIADSVLIPQASQQFYAEKIAYLPNSYQANDRKRVISEKNFSRLELGLPENAFVYCCFNKNYKILPNIFDIWMRILGKVEGSVLWLLEDNPSVVINLRIEAQKRDIDPARLIFAKRMPLADHLARHRAADLFLDTFPYNAHTTTSDALWAGLPVLTMMGNSFASRVSASLLRAIELPELITSDEFTYETLAIKLACNPTMLNELRTMLENNRLSAPLFNTPLFASHIETAYQKMYDRYQANMSPEHLFIT